MSSVFDFFLLILINHIILAQKKKKKKNMAENMFPSEKEGLMWPFLGFFRILTWAPLNL